MKPQALVPVIFLTVLATFASAQDNSKRMDALLALSLEDLLKVKVYSPSAYTKIAPARNPASITTITAEDIRLTPARNISDLLEIYVPGAFYTTHNEGAHMGIRGIMSDRNVKFLLLVNSRNINQKGHNGVRTEIDHWDMADIQRIEVIRGPGSVVNGPGAIGGVINIITHTAETAPGTKLGLQHHQKYDSTGLSLSHAGQHGEATYYVYASAVRTMGKSHRTFGQSGYETEDINIGDQLLDHYSDYDDSPQIKLHTDIRISPELRFWGRYTESGRVRPTRNVRALYDGILESDNQQAAKHLILQIENAKQISENLALQTIVSVDSMDIEYREGNNIGSFNNVQNLQANFSEDEIYLKTLFNWDYSQQLDFAFGAEYSWDHLGPGWNDSEDEFILGDGRNIISDSSSIHLSTAGGNVNPVDAVFAGNGFNTDMLSIFGEANIQPDDKSTWLLSARADYHDIGGAAVSPRIAYSRQLENQKVFKAILQRSVRFNTMEQLWIQDKLKGSTDSPEEINNLELILSDYSFEDQVFNYILYVSDAEFLGWSFSDSQTTNVGEAEFVGFEFEYSFSWHTGKLGLNYSFLELLDFDIDPSQQRNGISFSDYNRPTAGFFLDGSGKSLNNWFNQAAKIWLQWQPAPLWTVHMDAHLMWEFDGPRDGISDTIEATAGDPAQLTAIEREYVILKTDAYDHDFRLNMSLTYEFADNTTLGIYGHNIIGANGNKRYHYDTGNGNTPFSRARFIEEPRHISFRFNTVF